MSELLSRVVVLLGGTLYPAYRSYKAVRTKDVREYVKWMMYWIVFAIFQNVEAVADVFISFWFPFYYHLKIIFVIWLLSPWTKGASILYRKWVHPALSRREKDIDHLLDQAKSESYNQMVRLGSQGLMCAKDIVATAAIRGQMQIVQQLQKSYSANDVSQVGMDKPLREHTTALEHVYEDDGSDEEKREDTPSRPPRRNRSGSRTRTLEGGEDEYPATMPRRSNRNTRPY